MLKLGITIGCAAAMLVAVALAIRLRDAAFVGLALFTILRCWLPNRSIAGGLVGVAIGAGVAVRPAGLLTSANSDFTLVAPVALAVALCVATLVLFGATFAWSTASPPAGPDRAGVPGAWYRSCRLERFYSHHPCS